MDVETRFGPVERSFVCPLGHAVRRVVLQLAAAASFVGLAAAAHRLAPP
jgi:hypothetical protein